MSDERPLSRRRRCLRYTVRGGALVFVGLVAFYFWLARDQSSRIAQRRGAVESVVRGPEIEHGAYIDQGLRIASTTGLEVELLVRRPANADGRAPLVFLMGGLKTGKDAARLVEADRPVVVAALSYPTELDKIRKNLGVFADIAEARRAILDTPAAVMLALDQLCAEPYVDPARIELVGVSLGAPFACVAGALDPRVKRVWSIHGGGDPAGMIAKGLEEDIAFGPARWFIARIAAGLAHASTLAPERWVGKIAPRPFVMVNAKDDGRILKACVETLYDAANEPRELIWDAGGHIDKDKDEALRALTEMVLERM